MTKDERLTEKETILRWDGHKDTVRVFTASPTVARKIEKAGYARTRQSTMKGQWSGSFYQIPYKDLRWGVRRRQAPKTGTVPRGFQPRKGV